MTNNNWLVVLFKRTGSLSASITAEDVEKTGKDIPEVKDKLDRCSKVVRSSQLVHLYCEVGIIRDHDREECDCEVT